MQYLVRNRAPEEPRGRKRISWYGPGLLWMLSAVGTGSVLFTPRVGSAYGFQLLWILLLVVFFMWIMIKEVARYPIVTGKSILEGLQRLPGPGNWAVWVIFIPQLFAAAVGIAGLSAIIGSALQSFLPGSGSLYGIAFVIFSSIITVSGSYNALERISQVMAIALMLMAVVSAAVVFPALPKVLPNIVPSVPEDPDIYIILPWVGTILAGSMGILWFSYWTASKGFGGGLSDQVSPGPPDPNRKLRNRDKTYRIRAWVNLASKTAALAVLAGLLVIFSFLVLGAELLGPAGILPQGKDVALDLSRLFSEIWGDAGKVLIIASLVVALGGSILANQDGWGRSFADISMLLSKSSADELPASPKLVKILEQKSSRAIWNRNVLKRWYIGLITGVVPVVILLIFKDPVAIMSASGIIAAVHTPFIVFTAFAAIRIQLPLEHRPGWFSSVSMILAGMFFLVFAAVYIFSGAA
ncbi:Nramp family divalent metal transporter [Salinispira pacifica]|uniref:Manganese transport protein MntH n=1 Tax=Salinispira pacifica TaxID=1307761 RepID=V5WM49_9SPIO|nr:Nramp family divalent metal transporter [Salinispira pacifica]AHC16695.1 hypothetical protein L21SP2_3357 [Salinispira pacifica]